MLVLLDLPLILENLRLWYRLLCIISFCIISLRKFFCGKLFHYVYSSSLGTTNSFSLVALTKHSIGNSRPSRTLKVKCPALPPRIDEVFQVDTNQLGVILLTWQVPYRPTEFEAKGKNDVIILVWFKIEEVKKFKTRLEFVKLLLLISF